MSITRLRITLRSCRRRSSVLASILCLSGVLVLAHSAAGEGHMGDGMAMCLAVVTGAATGAMALGLALRNPLPVPAPFSQAPLATSPRPYVGAVEPRSRAGPTFLQVFLR